MMGVVGLMMMRWTLLAQITGLGGWAQTAAVPPNSTAVAQTENKAEPAGPGESADSHPAFASFRDTTFGKLFQGKKTLSPGEAVQLQF